MGARAFDIQVAEMVVSPARPAAPGAPGARRGRLRDHDRC